MKEKPINFNNLEVWAIIEGRKTQTRRIVKPQPNTQGLKGVYADLYNKGPEWAFWLSDNRMTEPQTWKPDYQVGDRLWVQEQLRGDGQPGDRRVGIARYGADGEMVLPCTGCGNVWCNGSSDGCGLTRMDVVWQWSRPVMPSIHMPRWASRITLEVTGVRVERVQNMNRGDAMAEGCPFPNMAKGANPLHWYHDLWDSIHGPGAWERNDWVWVYDLKRV